MGKFLVNKATGQKYRIDGVRQSAAPPSQPDLAETHMSQILSAIDRLPNKVDLRPAMTKVENQAAVGSW